MKLAIISPTGLLEKYSLANYHLALAHLALDEQDDSYARYYGAHGRSDTSYVILDNSVIELGQPMELVQLERAIQKVMPEEFVLPDYPQDPNKTLEAARKTRDYLSRKLYKMRFMVVPQWSYNKYLWEWFDNMQQLWPYADTIGVPKFLREKRIEALRMIEANNLNTQKEFHLLGTWGNPIELKTIQHEFPWIRGVDSKIPVRLGQRGVMLHPTLGLVLERESLASMSLTHNSDPFPAVVAWNIQLMRAWCDGRDVFEAITESPFGKVLRVPTSK